MPTDAGRAAREPGTAAGGEVGEGGRAGRAGRGSLFSAQKVPHFHYGLEEGAAIMSFNRRHEQAEGRAVCRVCRVCRGTDQHGLLHEGAPRTRQPGQI